MLAPSAHKTQPRDLGAFFRHVRRHRMESRDADCRLLAAAVVGYPDRRTNLLVAASPQVNWHQQEKSDLNRKDNGSHRGIVSGDCLRCSNGRANASHTNLQRSRKWNYRQGNPGAPAMAQNRKSDRSYNAKHGFNDGSRRPSLLRGFASCVPPE